MTNVNAPLDPRNDTNLFGFFKRPIWKCNTSDIPNAKEFTNLFQIDKIVHSGKMSTVAFIKDAGGKNILNGGRSFVKIYDCNDKNKSKVQEKIDHCWSEYKLIQMTNLLEYYYMFHDDISNKMIIEMQVYDGTLYSHIKKHGVIKCENKVKQIIGDILDKLWILHNCYLVHADMKPSNIMLRDFPQEKPFIKNGWKIIDFETRQIYKTKGKSVGTITWTPPEMNVHSNKNVYRYSVDTWALGLIILFIMFGTHPFDLTQQERQYYMNLSKCKSNHQITPSITEEIKDVNVTCVDHNEEKIDNEIQMKSDFLKCKTTDECIGYWYDNCLLKSETVLRKQLVKLYDNGEISLSLFELLHDGLLVFNPKKRFQCKDVYYSKWFKSIKAQRN